MIQLTTTLPDLYRVTIMDVAKQITNYMHHSAGITSMFKNRYLFSSIGSSTSMSNNEDGDPNVTENRAEIMVKYSSSKSDRTNEANDHNDDKQTSLPWGDIGERYPLFRDVEHNIIWVTHDTLYTITQEHRLVFDDMVAAIDAQQRIKALYSDGVFTSDVLTSQILPSMITGITYALFKQTDADPTTYVDYLRTYSLQKITKMHNRHDDTDVALGFIINKNGLVSRIEFDQGEPEVIGSDKSANMYALSYTVTTQVSLSGLMTVEFPIVVNNMLVPSEYLGITEEVYTKRRLPAHPVVDINTFISTLDDHRFTTTEPYRMPWYDDWDLPPQYTTNKTFPICIVNFTIDDVANPNGVTELDINDIGLIPEIMDNINSMDAPLLPSSLYHISVFRDNVMIEPSVLTYDTDTQIITIPNRDTRAVYRLVIQANEEHYINKVVFGIANLDIRPTR